MSNRSKQLAAAGCAAGARSAGAARAPSARRWRSSRACMPRRPTSRSTRAARLSKVCWARCVSPVNLSHTGELPWPGMLVGRCLVARPALSAWWRSAALVWPIARGLSGVARLEPQEPVHRERPPDGARGVRTCRYEEPRKPDDSRRRPGMSGASRRAATRAGDSAAAVQRRAGGEDRSHGRSRVPRCEPRCESPASARAGQGRVEAEEIVRDRRTPRQLQQSMDVKREAVTVVDAISRNRDATVGQPGRQEHGERRRAVRGGLGVRSIRRGRSRHAAAAVPGRSRRPRQVPALRRQPGQAGGRGAGVHVLGGRRHRLVQLRAPAAERRACCRRRTRCASRR